MPKNTRQQPYSLPERQLTDRERAVLPFSDEEIEEMRGEMWPSPTVKRHVMEVMNCSESTFYKSYSHRFTYRAYARRIVYRDGQKKLNPADFKIPAGAALKQLAQILLEGREGETLRA